MSKKGFLLIDSILNVFIVTAICSLCLAIFMSMLSYDDGYISYTLRSNENLSRIFNNIAECEVCIIDESD